MSLSQWLIRKTSFSQFYRFRVTYFTEKELRCNTRRVMQREPEILIIRIVSVKIEQRSSSRFRVDRSCEIVTRANIGRSMPFSIVKSG